MTNTILQVRDMPVDVLAKLRERAAAQGMSLSQYVRDLLSQDAAQPTISEVVDQIAARAPVNVSDEEILDAIHEDRR
ncbi:MAG TPA: antitoxin [Nocardioidaceae bacterium]|nr:antitoxin [Nocardioidaceae bacterium]